MISRVLEDIKRYYLEFTIEDVARARLRTENEALRLAERLRSRFSVVAGPRVEPEAKCVRIQVSLEASQPGTAPEFAVSTQPDEDFTTTPSVGIFMSWVAHCAIVRTSASSQSSDLAWPTPAPSVVKAVRDAGEACAHEVRVCGFELLSEDDIRIPVDVDLEKMKEKDGSLVLPPPQVGKCLFYPWWGGV